MTNPTEDLPMPEAPKKTYRCLNPVRHNGRRYTTEIDLTADEAAPLLSARAITKSNASADTAVVKKVEAKPKKEQKVAEKKTAEAEKVTVVEPAADASANTTEAPKAPEADAK
ncbi:hypothetical protein N9J88_03345 [Porticoccaceae bacterium]|nr:hypothetical protein [Porticoccaceae bacterium]